MHTLNGGHEDRTSYSPLLTNRKTIEVQVARKFLREHFLEVFQFLRNLVHLLSVNQNTGYDASPTMGQMPLPWQSITMLTGTNLLFAL